MPTLNNSKNNCNDCNDEKNVNETSSNVKADEANEPTNDEYYCNNIK